jgi:hypothetical protein
MCPWSGALYADPLLPGVTLAPALVSLALPFPLGVAFVAGVEGPGPAEAGRDWMVEDDLAMGVEGPASA